MTDPSSPLVRDDAPPPSTSGVRRPGQSPRAGSRGLGPVVVGVVLVLAGVAWLADAAGVMSWRWPLLLAGALALVGVALLAVARRGGHDGLVVMGLILAVVALLAPLAPSPLVWGTVGDRTLQPQTTADLDESVGLAAGSLTVDLRDLAIDGEPVRLQARVGLGELVVWLPDDAAVDVRATSGAGEVTVGSRTSAGLGVGVDHRLDGDGDVWQLDVATGLGRVEVRR